ncbi:catalase family protein [Pleomorphovibrio marinus]|uniref:catalase n=1 Tax=Pleomorphovibrio marinus TaxID=2164132 RepID=UPI000E0A06FA|nr:catalase [Pleomorphovibrio marinus]
MNQKAEENTEEIIQTMKRFLNENYAQGAIKRNFHPKMHGCLKATLKIRADIAPHLRHGIFREERNYDAWLRLSNAPPKSQSDTNSSGRGLAIKVLDVEGEQLDADPLGIPTQNFLLTSSPILSTWNTGLYKKAIKAVLFGFWERLWFAINPLHWRSIFLTFKYAKKHDNLLGITYFSGAAFCLGPAAYVKFILKPKKNHLGYTLNKPKGENFLREQLVMDLGEKDYYFILGVQVHESKKKQPLENTSKVWEAPFIPLADLQIPKQEFDTSDRRAFGDKLVFSPWIGLKDHLPVGELNQARRRVYQELAALRS